MELKAGKPRIRVKMTREDDDYVYGYPEGWGDAVCRERPPRLYRKFKKGPVSGGGRKGWSRRALPPTEQYAMPARLLKTRALAMLLSKAS